MPLVARGPRETALHINARFRVNAPPLPNKKPALLGSAFLFGNAQGLNLRAARDQLLVLFVDPGFFKEVRAVRVYGRIDNRRSVVCMRIFFMAQVVDELENYESKYNNGDPHQPQPNSISR